MKKRCMFFCIFISMLCLSACGNLKDDDVIEDSTESNEGLNALLLDGYSTCSKLEDYAASIDLNTDHEEVNLNLKNEISDLVDTTYEKNKEYSRLEAGRNYDVSFQLSKDATIDASSKVKKSTKLSTAVASTLGFTIEGITLNGVSLNYTYDSETNRFTIHYQTPESSDNVSSTLVITLKDEDGNLHYINKTIEMKVEQKAIYANVNNVKAFSDRCQMNVSLLNKTGVKLADENFFFVISDGENIIKKIPLEFKENNFVEINNLLIGHTYQYALINLNSDGEMNAGYIKGTFSSLLPYKTIINNITSSSIDFNLYDKGSIATVTGVYVYDEDKLIKAFELKDNYHIDNLEANHDYNIKIDYSYELDEEIKINSFYKKIRTTKADETSVELEFNTDDLKYKTENGITTCDLTWNNGTSIFVSDTEVRDSFIYLKKPGSIQNDNAGNIEYSGAVLQLNLPFNSIVTATVVSAASQGQYIRTCNLTNGIEYYYLDVYSYLSEFVPQSFYLSAGTYYIYSSDYGIQLRDIVIREIMSQEQKEALTNGLNAVKCLNPLSKYLTQGAEISLDALGVYLTNDNNVRVKDEDITVTISDSSHSVTLNRVDQIPSDMAGRVTVMIKSNTYNIELSDMHYILASGEYTPKIEFYDGVNYIGTDLELAVNEQLTTSSEGIQFIVEASGIHANIKYLEFDLHSSLVSYEYMIDGIKYTNIYDLPTETAKTIEVLATYTNNGIQISQSFNTYIYEYTILSQSKEDNVILQNSAFDIYNQKIYTCLLSAGDYGTNRLFSYNELMALYQKGYGKVNELEVKFYELTEEQKVYCDFSTSIVKEIYLETYFGDVLVQGEIKLIIIKATVLETYNGTTALEEKENYDDWEISLPNGFDYEVTKVNQYIGGQCNPSDPDNVKVLKLNKDSSITSKEFAASNEAYITIIGGTTSTVYDVNFTVELLDKDGNVVYSYTDVLVRNKETKETIIHIANENIAFTQIRINNFYPTCNDTTKTCGVLSISATVVHIEE